MKQISAEERAERKKFYKMVFALVLPMALQNLINVGVSSADVIMLGRVGETALSGASLAGQVQFIMTLIFFGLTSGAAVLTAQYWGKRDIKTIEKVFGIALRISLAVGILFTVLVWVIPYQIMGLFTPEADVIHEGVRYLKVVSFSYIFIINYPQSVQSMVFFYSAFVIIIRGLLHEMYFYPQCAFQKVYTWCTL